LFICLNCYDLNNKFVCRGDIDEVLSSVRQLAAECSDEEDTDYDSRYASPDTKSESIKVSNAQLNTRDRGSTSFFNHQDSYECQDPQCEKNYCFDCKNILQERLESFRSTVEMKEEFHDLKTKMKESTKESTGESVETSRQIYRKEWIGPSAVSTPSSVAESEMIIRDDLQCPTDVSSSFYDQERERKVNKVMINFRELLWFWREYYLRRGRDRLSVEFSSQIPFHAWKDLVGKI
jgi:hypothetical protein